MRLDGLLHKEVMPKWARDNEHARAFAVDMVPMLRKDRELIDQNWQAMLDRHWLPGGLPNARYSPNLDGLELTVWMIEDFKHLLRTGSEVDEDLAKFNRQRRSELRLPAPWDGKVWENYAHYW